jgi:hypothetical protein
MLLLEILIVMAVHVAVVEGNFEKNAYHGAFDVLWNAFTPSGRPVSLSN